jgi:hypothetical protein
VIAKRERVLANYFRGLIRLAFLAVRIVEAITVVAQDLPTEILAENYASATGASRPMRGYVICADQPRLIP